MTETLQLWWAKKYQIPWNHELFQDRTLFDLLIEFNLDYFEKNPLEVHRNKDGHVQFKDTGDTLIDKWEEQVAKGLTPDFLESFDEEALAKLSRLRKKGDYRIGSTATLKETVESVKIQEEQMNKPMLKPRFG